ncbi:MAG TPA: PhzF family phenazine biosynthesis protein [Povalibacter sp.]|nr:PhzF family phenazine biosynthesis protein [Povalibacter sp.]
MPSLTFRILNVFTQDGGTFTGNPLCVFEDGTALDGSTMQKLARQFNLSETTFILPSSRANARVRIFTPDYEMPFAGHPTLGTAFVCRALGLGGDTLTLEMQAGIIPVHAVAAHWTLQATPATWRPVDTPVATLARMLGLAAADIGAPPLWVKAGKEQLVIPLRSADAVRRIRVDGETFAAVRSEDGVSMAYVFAETAPGQVLARFFFTNGGIAEDPATGSATANFGGWLLAQNRALPLSYEISQGEYTRRPSTLLLNVTEDRRILVSGEVIEIGRGTLQT